MSWTALDNSPQWTVKDTDLLVQSFYMLMENAGADPVSTTITTYNTSMFTPQQFINAVNDRQRRFLRDTGLVIKRVTQGLTSEIGRYDLPQDWMDTRRVDFKPAGGSWYALFRSDAYTFDHGMSNWQQDFGPPQAYQEATTPLLQVDIAPAPDSAGDAILTYIGTPDRPSALLPGGGIFVPFYGLYMLIPDEFAPYVFYGALADLLNADGDGRDPKRAQYCESRYAMGVELAKLLLEGQ